MGNRGVGMNEYIKFQGLVSAHQDTIIFKDIPNKFVEQGMKGIIGFINMQSAHISNSAFYAMPAYNWSMYLGTGSENTTPAMTALSTPIGTTPGTAPTLRSISFKDGSLDGIWDIIYTATWNTGTITGTVTEMGLYLTAPRYYTYSWESSSSATYDSGRQMMSRLCTGDSEFEAFTIDDTKPLTIDWKIRFTFG